ncbi:ATP-binding cassette domain-containing protein [Heliobacterium gestii]|uniref:ATP-binding cassette domain-containing protein n=1 Tax=Heliomicrobium gestii TaxID=2699 RepID=A0A845L8L3_HELGE|nr:ABC transporter ATP-binding protein [Heliomicrobium gestii]MBM7865293.1 putative ABC transport system ATP-binding protein [Heliomicrobium gestii]MZP41554.1 ATP-binding cassette domain-containing protein [Heliomicrobium gestii]
MNTLVTTKKLRKSYGHGDNKVEVLHDIDLTIQEGEFLALAGPSGSGKSTLLTLIGGLNRPDSGDLIIDGIDLYRLPGEQRADFRREYIGFVFQQFHLMPYLTALENVMLPLAVTAVPAREQRRRAQELLEQMGLSGRERHLPGQLSGGEQERVAIARALINKPALILADEPTGALDSQTGEQIMDLFGQLNRSGMTIVMVTHNPDHLNHASRIIHMKDGRLR